MDTVAAARDPASHRRKCVENKQQKKLLFLFKKKPRLLLLFNKDKEKEKEKHLVLNQPHLVEALVAEAEKTVVEKIKEKKEEKKKQEYKQTHWWECDGDRPSRAEVLKRWPLPEEEYQKKSQFINMRAGWTTGDWEPLPVDAFVKRMKEIGYNPDDYYHGPPNRYTTPL